MTKTRSYLISTALAGSLGLNVLTLSGLGISEADAAPEPINAQCTIHDPDADFAALAAEKACAQMRVDNPDILECNADGLHDIRAIRAPMDPDAKWSIRAEGVFSGVRTIVEGP